MVYVLAIYQASLRRFIGHEGAFFHCRRKISYATKTPDIGATSLCCIMSVYNIIPSTKGGFMWLNTRKNMLDRK